MSLHEAVGVESSQYWSRSILHRAVPSCGDDVIISFSLLTGTSRATPSEYQSFIPASSSASWWMVGAVIPVQYTTRVVGRKVKVRFASKTKYIQYTFERIKLTV